MNLPFDDATFDAAISTYGMTAVENVDPAIDEMIRVVRPGGRLAIAEVHFVNWPTPAAFNRGCDRRAAPVQQVVHGSRLPWLCSLSPGAWIRSQPDQSDRRSAFTTATALTAGGASEPRARAQPLSSLKIPNLPPVAPWATVRFAYWCAASDPPLEAGSLPHPCGHTGMAAPPSH